MKILLTVAFALFFQLAWGQQDLEIIELKAATVDRVLPALRPLLEPGATLSGMNGQLFLRASARNRAEIRRALAALDRQARQLVIRVSFQRGEDGANSGARASGAMVLGTPGRGQIEARTWDTRSQRNENGGQMVRTQEGSPAFIQVGGAFPLPMRQVIYGAGGVVVNESVVYQDVGQGFYAVPQLNGNRVTLDISQQADSLVRNGSGRINSQQLNTTVSGRLGEWIELGGTGNHSRDREGGGFSRSSGEMRDQRSIWLKVEEVD